MKGDLPPLRVPELEITLDDSQSSTSVAPTYRDISLLSPGPINRQDSEATSPGASITDHPPPSPTLSVSETSVINRASSSLLKVDGPTELTRDRSSRNAIQQNEKEEGNVDITPFNLHPSDLAAVVQKKDLEGLRLLGGVSSILQSLGTHSTNGIGTSAELSFDLSSSVSSPILGTRHGLTASINDRRRVYGSNVLPTRPAKSPLTLMRTALTDNVISILAVLATISLALGLYQDLRPTRSPTEPKPVLWVEGLVIMAAILIVVAVGSVSDHLHEKQFQSLAKKGETVEVIRDGRSVLIPTKDLVVGDITFVQPGMITPCDGVLLRGHNVKCDESGLTGESDVVNKQPIDNIMLNDCFIVSGSRVTEGVGRYVVLAVGKRCHRGRVLQAHESINQEPETACPQKRHLKTVASSLTKLAFASSSLILCALLIKFFAELGNRKPPWTPAQAGSAFVDVVLVSIAVVAVAMPEGVSLASRLATNFTWDRMFSQRVVMRDVTTMESLASTTVVCTDKTGTLTQPIASVPAGAIGVHAKFVQNLDPDFPPRFDTRRSTLRVTLHSDPHPTQLQTAAISAEDSDSNSEDAEELDADFSIDRSFLYKVLSIDTVKLINEAIAVNSTAFLHNDENNPTPYFVGNKTEVALLDFARRSDWQDYVEVRQEAEIVDIIPFSRDHKTSAVVIKLKDGSGYRLHIKGASEILAQKCRRHIVVRRNHQEWIDGGVETRRITSVIDANIEKGIKSYSKQMLPTVALCYKDFPVWPPPHSAHTDTIPYEDLILIGVFAIQESLRLDAEHAVSRAKQAGISVRMVTGDNIHTALAVADQIKIFSPGGIVMDGPSFRQLDHSSRLDIITRLQVLARASPKDKKVFVESLQAVGEIVGVTGDGSNDSPALKSANVGFSMGISGTEVAREASDIILMDDNFSSIVTAIMWTRCVKDFVRRFLQFQLAVTLACIVITFVSSLASGARQPALTPVQLVWINIIVDTFVPSAFALDFPTRTQSHRGPPKVNAPWISTSMLKQVVWQSSYQVAFALIFHFLGAKILGFRHPPDPVLALQQHKVVSTLVFNAFVFAQIFNAINCRRTDEKFNILEGVLRNKWFFVILLLEIVAQILVIFFGDTAFNVTRLQGREWGISVALGFGSIPLGALIRLLPNGIHAQVFRKLRLLGDETLLPTEREIKDSRSRTLSPAHRDLFLPSPTSLTHSPRRGGAPRSGGMLFHPETPMNDPLLVRWREGYYV